MTWRRVGTDPLEHGEGAAGTPPQPPAPEPNGRADARPVRVLLVDDDEEQHALTRDLLASAAPQRYEVEWCPDFERGLARLLEPGIDVALVDFHLGGRTGLDLIRRVVATEPAAPPLVLLTGHRDGRLDGAALEAGAVDFLQKDEITAPVLERTLRYVRRQHQALQAVRRSEARFRALVEYGADGVATVDGRGIITYISPAVRRLLALREEEVVGRPFTELVHPDDQAPALERWAEILARPGVPVRMRLRGRHQSGEWRLFDCTSVNRLDEPALGAIVTNFADVTEGETAQRRLDEREELFRAVFTAASDAILIADDDARYVAANHAAEALLNLPADQIVGRTARDFTPPGLDHDAAWNTFLAAGRMSGTYQLARPDGSLRDVEFAAVASVLPHRHLSVLRDVTERNRAQQTLRRTEGRLRGLFESNLVNIAFAGADGTILEANDAFLEMTGRGRRALECGELSWRGLSPEDKVESYRRSLQEAQQHGRSTPFEHQYLRPDGTRIWLYVALARLADTGEIVELSIDNSRQKLIEHALVESERRFATIFANSPLAIYIARIDTGELIEVNEAFCGLTGYSREESIGRSTLELGLWVDPRQRQALIDALRAGGVRQTIEARFRRRTDEQRHVLISIDRVELPGARDLFAAVVTDVTERHGLQEQLRQAQKMEAVGRLAGGVAHDFNNLLTAMLGYAELVLEEQDLPGHVKKDVEEIRKAAESAAGLTRQLLAFSRRQVLQTERLDLNEIVSRVQMLLRRVLGEDVELRIALSEGIPTVLADASQIEQMLMNLAVNARDAMRDGGRLTIETNTVVLDESYVAEHQGASPGRHVMLAVSDTGMGMSDDVRARIFEPFFTTKEKGKGTGLGLATVYGAVKQMGGSIWVYSEPGRGTSFKIYLPAIEGPAARELTGSQPVVSLAGTESVLLVEDQDEVRRVAAQMLARHGYTVTEAGSPTEALEMARRAGAAFDLLLTDVVMPEMSGRQLARLVEVALPGVRVLYTSGYTEDAIVHHGVLDPGLAFVPKPFTPQSLLTKVREVLDGPAAPGV